MSTGGVSESGEERGDGCGVFVGGVAGALDLAACGVECDDEVVVVDVVSADRGDAIGADPEVAVLNESHAESDPCEHSKELRETRA